VAVWPGLDVGDDSEAGAGEQAVALRFKRKIGPSSGSGTDMPTKSSPANCGPIPGPSTKPIAAGASTRAGDHPRRSSSGSRLSPARVSTGSWMRKVDKETGHLDQPNSAYDEKDKKLVRGSSPLAAPDTAAPPLYVVYAG
jgi:hypothetical protein